ncbi:MAG: efflux RND transporter periplasmic adaptor subunit [Bacteroides sp.]|nr:efflux RND transporter periplasmic adaptor subunit [Bacteroides sp.]
MTRKSLWYCLCMVSLFTSCSGKKEKHSGYDYRISGDTVYVNPDNLVASRIRTVSVSEEPYSKEIVTAGTIQPISTQYAYIAPPFAGRVVRSYVRLGQPVTAHTPLFEIISSDFMTAQKEFFQAQAERELAMKDMQRKEDLFRNGVTSQKELEEAQNLLKIAEKEYENAYSAIRIYQMDPEDMVLGQPLIIRSPIHGEVIETNLVAGQYLKDDADPVAVVANLSNVWVTAQVKEKDLRFIHEKSKMKIVIPAYPGKEILGEVFHIDEAIDEETRSVKVLSTCSNHESILKLGMYVTIHFTNMPRQQLVVPEKALLQDEKSTFVFVATAPDVYVKRPVEVDVTQDGKAYITDGLRPGEKVISEGGYYLK